MVRLLTNKAKLHFNEAVTLAKDARLYEALGEVNTALELNARLVEGHVLRGSLLGRLERPEDAREAFEEALRHSPQALRAHQYLLQIDTVAESVPLLTRLRSIVGIAAGVSSAALLVAAVAIYSAPSAPAPSATTASSGASAPSSKMVEAWKAFEARDFISADAASRRADADARVALLRAMDGTLTEELRRAEDLSRSSSEKALKHLGAVDQWQLRPVDRQQVQEVRARLALAAARRIASLKETLIVSAAAGVPNREAELALEQQTKLFQGQFTETGSMLEAELARVQMVAIPREADRLYGDAEEAVAQGDEYGFQRALAAVKLIPGIDDASVKRTEALARKLYAQQAMQLREELRGALESSDDSRVVEIAAKLRTIGDAVPLTEQPAVEAAAGRIALAAYYQLLELADRIEAGSLSRPEAEEALGLVQQAEGPLPPRLEDRARENINQLGELLRQQIGAE
jgi:tetratricopeptide (TPR) repeat protein